MWLVFALATTLLWGAADLFYKKGADARDRYSHLKTAVMVGLVMGLHACYTLVFGGVSYNPVNLLVYLPVSMMYILSMTIGYFGLRYLELSISSPIQNSSGAVTCILCLLLLGQSMDLLSGVAVVCICLGVFLLGWFERVKYRSVRAEDQKYAIGFMAFMMPVLYCVIDALGTFFDAFYLDDIERTPLVGVTEQNFEEVANISYELTFLICAALLLFYICIVKRQRFAILGQRDRGIAAVLETAGQFTYVYAMSGGNGVVAAPLIASYCVFSVLFSAAFLKERLKGKQYAVILLVLLGIVLLGVAEGLAE